MDQGYPIGSSGAGLWESLEPYFPPLHPPHPPMPPCPPQPHQVLPRLPLSHQPQPHQAQPHMLQSHQAQGLIVHGPPLLPLAVTPRPTHGAFPNGFIVVGAPPMRLEHQGVLRPPTRPLPSLAVPQHHANLQQSLSHEKMMVGSQQMPQSPKRNRKRKDEVTGSYRVLGSIVTKMDCWTWRKYGRKSIKGSPYPRDYYRCHSHRGCEAKKMVEKSVKNPRLCIVAYSGVHKNNSSQSGITASNGGDQKSEGTSENVNDQNANFGLESSLVEDLPSLEGIQEHN